MKKIFILFFLLSCSLFGNKQLKILNWPEYIDVNIIKEFTSKTAIEVEYTIYNNNEDLIKKLKTQNNYDVVLPSSSYLSKMINQKLLSKLETSKLSSNR